MLRVRAISWRNVQAQAMVEVAIFGSIIIFLVGAIVKNVVTTSFAQQYALRTMREAMTEAAKEVTVMGSKGPVLVQKPYNLNVIEDRLFPGVTKYGAMERTPYIASTNAVFTNDLFGEAYDLAIYDTTKDPADRTFGSFNIPVLHMRVNGYEKAFTLGAWRVFPGPCYVAVRVDPPGSGSAWRRTQLTDVDFKKKITEAGRVTCFRDATGGYPEPVFQKIPSNPPEYYIDPTAGDINPFDPSQGLQPTEMSIQTEVKQGTQLVVPASGKSSRSDVAQTDTVYRKIKGNTQTFWLNTTINNNRSHQW